MIDTVINYYDRNRLLEDAIGEMVIKVGGSTDDDDDDDDDEIMR